MRQFRFVAVRQVSSRAAIAVLTTLFVFVIAGPGVISVRADKPPQYFVDENKLPFDALSGTTTTRLWGVQGGAGYRIEVPANWNGELVLFAHGYRGGGLELTVSNPPIRRYLVEHGFAWAASSYATNGYDVTQGVKDMHGLGNRFNALVGHPSRVYFTGQSMGGHITGVAIEQYPNAYDGAMPMCGVMGANKLFDYFVENHLAAHALAGLDVPFPFPADYATTIVPQLKTLFGAPFPSALTPLGQKYAGVVENLSGGKRPMFDPGFRFASTGGNFLLTQGVGSAGGTRTNVDTVYQIDADPALSAEEMALNASIRRIDLDPQARHEQGLAGVPEIHGTLSIPVLSMHTLGDLFVPFSMEQIYARRAAENGDNDLLVTRAIRDINHCGFNTTEMERGFAALVNWVSNGVKPAGDDILTPAVVANPNFGCNFTVGSHTLAPACQ
jgi:pimeloyl-ACP methyl ester carboxylesterase